MSFLFGSQPKVVNTGPQPTTSDAQQNILSQLAGLLQTGQQPAGVQAYTGQFAAPQTAGQGNVIQQLLDLASTVGPGSGSASLATSLPSSVANAANFQAPQVSAPQVNFSPITPTIDSSAAFQKGVVNPVTQNFLQTVIPSLNAAAGRSAGGIYSSDTAGATDQAVSNLNTTLEGTGAQYALGASEANQAAQETTNSLLAQIAEANQSAQSSTNALNVGSALQGQGLDLAALAQAPGAIAAPQGIASLLESIFPTISTPQSTQQTQLSGQYQDFLNQISQAQNLKQLMGSVGVSPTEQSNTVVQPGTSGLIPSLLGGIASNPIAGYAGLNALGLLPALPSDERLKVDIKKIGRLDKSKLPVYIFRYKGQPSNVRHIGLMAQDVEQKHPQAVGTIPGTDFKTVNYAEVALAEAFPEAA